MLQKLSERLFKNDKKALDFIRTPFISQYLYIYMYTLFPVYTQLHEYLLNTLQFIACVNHREHSLTVQLQQQLDFSTHRLSGLISSPYGLIREIHANINTHTNTNTLSCELKWMSAARACTCDHQQEKLHMHYMIIICRITYTTSQNIWNNAHQGCIYLIKYPVQFVIYLIIFFFLQVIITVFYLNS